MFPLDLTEAKMKNQQRDPDYGQRKRFDVRANTVFCSKSNRFHLSLHLVHQHFGVLSLVLGHRNKVALQFRH